MSALKVLDREIARAGGEEYADGRDLIEARASLVELLVAACSAAEWITEAGIRHRDMPNSATLSRLTAAIARAGGAA